MSRNQAKFFIRKGRLSVDGNVVTDPYFEVAEASHVVFDGNSISISEYRYILLHKPALYACTTKDTEHTSVIKLLKSRSEDDYYYFANTLAPEATGLILLSDDARWTSRMKRRLLRKPRVYRIRSKTIINDDQLQQISEAGLVLDVQRHDPSTLLLKTSDVGMQKIIEICASVDMAIEAPHLQQLGRLRIEDLAEGEYLELAEEEIRI